MMALRRVQFNADIDGMTPKAPQFAGVQGDHRATDILITLDDRLISSGHLYRVEFMDCMNNYDTTELLIPDEESNTITVPLTRSITRTGGIWEVRLIVSQLGADLSEEFVLFTLAGRIYLDSRQEGEAGETHEQRGLSALISDAKAATFAADNAASSATAAAQSADSASAIAQDKAGLAEGAASAADIAATQASMAATAAGEVVEQVDIHNGAAQAAADGAQVAREGAQQALSALLAKLVKFNSIDEMLAATKTQGNLYYAPYNQEV